MFQINVACGLWDLLDEGTDTVLDRLKGEAGATGVRLDLCSGPVVQLRPHADAAPRIFRSIGGVHFQADARRYAGTRVRPVVADWLRKRHPLPAVAEACAQRGLALRARISCCHNPVAATRYATASAKNLFDDANPDWLCLANPDVREYLRAMVQELSEPGHFDAIELDRLSFPACSPPPARPETRLDFGHVADWLTRLCFCESCRQLARRDGVDVDAAARSAMVTLQRCFDRGEMTGSSVPEFVDQDPILRAYTGWRCGQITSLLESLRQACRCRLVLVHRGQCAAGAGLDVPAAMPHVDALLRVCPRLAEDDVAALVRSAGEAAGGAGRVELGIVAWETPGTQGADLVRAVNQAANLGVASVDIEGYGPLPLTWLAAIRQAGRYARRESH